MRNAGGEIPEVAGLHVVGEIVSVVVDGGDARFAGQNERPFGFLVPVQFADAAGIEPHVDAGDGSGDRQLQLGYFARPAAFAHFYVRVGEGEARNSGLTRDLWGAAGENWGSRPRAQGRSVQ